MDNKKKFITKKHALKKNKEYEELMKVVYQEFLEGIKQGLAPWQRNYKIVKTTPINFITKNFYNGSNITWLSIMKFIREKKKNPDLPFSSIFDADLRFCTYNAIKKKGYALKPNSPKYYASYYNMVLVPLTEKELEKIDIEEHKIFKDDIPCKKIFIEKVFTLFNIDDIEAESLPTFEETYKIEHNDISHWGRLEDLDKIIDVLHINLTHHYNVTPRYIPALNKIEMPRKDLFDSEEAYYSTLFHELSHYIHDRISDNYKKISSIKDYNYAYGEVVAEMSSYSLSTYFGVNDGRTNKQREESLAYTKSWLSGMNEEEQIEALKNATKEAARIFDYLIKELEQDLEIENTSEIEEELAIEL